MCTVELAIDNIVEELLPVWLSDDFDLEAFVFKIAHFLSDHDRSAISKLDETELELVFLNVEHLGINRSSQADCGRGDGC